MITPAQQLLEKLLLNQQKQSPESSVYPLILFQYSCHVSLRETAATRTTANKTNARSRVQQQQQAHHAKVQAEADLYRRAQLRTPAENARRATWGGPLWVEYLTKELMRQQQGIIWVSTTTRPTPKWIGDDHDIRIVTATDLYQSMWEEDDAQQQQHHPLAVLLERIRARQIKETCTPIVMESLTPLVQSYGFSAALHFLQQLLATRSVVLLPVLSETLSAKQHQQLEDLAHTALWLSNHTGQVDLHVLRQGIREQNSTVREIWDFSIQQSENTFTLSVGKSAEEEDQDAPEQVNLLQAMNPALNPEAKEPQHQSQPGPAVVTKKITLKMEDDNKPPPTQKAAAAPAAPRIFLQDDDPEFEDYDEEDPDDDLDI